MAPFLKENLITTKDASELSGYTSDYLARLVRGGEITGKMIGHSWLIDTASLEIFLDKQKSFKSERARELASSRMKEYRIRHEHVERASRDLTKKIPVASRTGHPVSEIGLTHVSLRSHLLALSSAFAVIIVGANLASAEVLPNLAGRVASIAEEVSSGFNETFGDLPSHLTSKFNAIHVTMQENVSRVATENTIASTQLASPLLSDPDLSFLQMALGKNTDNENTRTRVATSLGGEASKLNAARGITREDVQTFVVDAFRFVTSPAQVATTLAHTYAAIGYDAYAFINSSFTSYRSLIEQSGEKMLALAATTRDTLATTPRLISKMNLALGTAVIDATHTAIRAEVNLAYGTATVSPEIARATVALMNTVGDVLMRGTIATPTIAKMAFLRATRAPAELAPALAEAVFDTEYAGASRFVALTNSVTDKYALALRSLGESGYTGAVGTRSLANATGSFIAHAPIAIENAYLGALGKSAVALDTLAHTSPVAAVLVAASPAFSASEKIALGTYQTIHGLFDSMTSALAFLFTPSIIAVVPTSVATSSPTRATTLVRQTVNTYPTYTTVVQGVSQDFMDQSLLTQRNDILARVFDMIKPLRDISNLIVRNGSFRGGNFDGGTLTNGISVSATTGNFGSLTAGNTNINGDLNIIGNQTITGSITIGTTTVNGLLFANGIISGNSFVATSTTATSTFAGSINIDNAGFVYATSTRNIGIGVLSPAALLALQNSTSTQPIFIASNAAGAEVYRITDNGFVGIGTTTPGYALAVEGSSSLGNQAIAGYFTATTSTATSTFAGSLAVGTTSPWGNGLFTVGTSTPLLHIDNNSGNVGINALASNYRLDINGTVRSVGDAFFNSNTSLGDATSTDITYFNSRIAGHLVPTIDNVSDLGDGTNWLRWRTGYFGTSIGIAGTATSTGISLLASGAYLIDSASPLSLNTTHNQNVLFGTGNVSFPNASTTNFSVASNLWVGGNATTSADGTFTTNGSVGIGTTNPLYKLDVNGTIRSVGDVFMNANASIGGTLAQTGLATFTNGFLSNASSTITTGLFSMNGGASTTNITATGTGYFGISAIAPTFIGALTGNADTATKFFATKNINGVAFDGSADITVPAHAGIDSYNLIAANIDGTANVPANTATFLNDAGTVFTEKVIAANAALVLIDNAANYVVADRDTGTWVVLPTENSIDYLRYLPYAEIYRSGTNLHVQVSPLYGYMQESKNFQRISKTERYARESGFDAISVDASLNITANGGIAWSAFTPFTIAAVTPATTWFDAHHVATAWVNTYHAGTPVINNTQYDDGTDLVTLTDTYWTINYIYRGIEAAEQNHLYRVLGNAQFPSLDLAKASNSISSLPTIISSHAMLIGRVIVQKNATSAYTIESAFSTVFAGSSAVTSHASLTGLLNDDHTQYALLVGRVGGQTLTGGTGITDMLTLKGTAGIGTLTSPAIQALVGTNGGTTALTILNNGNVGIGNSSPSYSLDVTGAGHFTSYLDAQSLVATSSSIASIFNGGFLSNASSTITSGLFTMSGGASTTNITASGTASTTNLIASSAVTFQNLTGILSSNGTSGITARTLTGTANQISIANGDGTGGNPTFSLPSLLAFTSASTSQLSVFNNTYFGATATSTFDSAGVLTLASALAVTSGGTGWANIQTGAIPYGAGAGALATTTQGQGGQILAWSGGIPAWIATTTIPVGGNISGTLSNLTVTTNANLTGVVTSVGNATSFATSPAFSGIASFANASTSQLSVFQKAYFGATATSTFDSSGALTLITPLLVGSGGTGATTLTGILQGNGTGAITGITGTAGQFPYYNGASTLLATSTIFLSTSGNIGIGTTSPNYKLEVNGSVNIPTGSTYKVNGIDVIGLWAAYGNNIANTNTGNVGIGTTTPGVRFVNSGAAAASSPTLGSGTVGADAILSVGGTYGLYTGVSGNGDVWQQVQRNDANATTYNLLLNPLGGNVGIGTVNPGYKLTVNGTGFFGNYITSSTFGSSNSIVTSGDIEFYNDGTPGVDPRHARIRPLLYGSYAGGIALDVSLTGASLSEAMRIDNNGNVGIGTTNPASFKLQVAGNIGPDANTTYDIGSTALRFGCIWTATGSTGTCVSDERLKQNITSLNFGTDPLGQLSGLQLRTFTYKNDPNNNQTLGLVAQEVLTVAPELVTTSADGYYAVRYGDIQWLTVAAIQQLNAIVKQLQPLTGVLSIEPGVESQCVVGNTRLRRRWGGSADVDDEYEFDEVDIKNIAVGDEIQSLDERTGTVVYSRVNALIDMGEQEVFELVTKSGRRIRTTSNHPFLARAGATKA